MVESAGERDDEAETRSYNWPAIGFSLVSARRLQLMKSSTVESTLERRDVNCMLAKGTCHQGRGLLPIILRSAIFFFFLSTVFFFPIFPSLVSLSFRAKGEMAESTGCITSSSEWHFFFHRFVRFIVRVSNFASIIERKNANLSTYWEYDRLKIV